MSLVNETFKWIDAHLKDSVDFVVWTGDSARHDNDEEIPRTVEQVTGLNELLVTKFVEVFGKGDRVVDAVPLPEDFIVPIVPTFGNNDVMPHNILPKGPNRWTKRYSSVWNRFIPEEQRHGFERGGWFYVEVIPHHLAVFSLNTLYFFDSNTAVDGCADRAEPGYEQMEWLRVQLQFLRERGMKAIITGHVPPARTDSKRSWDETCWQKYALWMRQYRDIVVGSMYGHMNLDHFVLQDSKDVDLANMDSSALEATLRAASDHDFSVQSSANYLKELRSDWADLPKPPSRRSMRTDNEKLLSNNEPDFCEHMSAAGIRNRKHRGKNRDYLNKIGGVWAERYSASFISPSVIPKYFPTIRIIHYNITGLDLDSGVEIPPPADIDPDIDEFVDRSQSEESDDVTTSTMEDLPDPDTDHQPELNKKKKHRRPKKPEFKVPKPPSKTSPPGPAYSPQSLTWLGYTQYYLNLTHLYHTDTRASTESDDASPNVESLSEDESSAKNLEATKPNENWKQIEFEVEYDTRDDSIYKLKDLTMRSLLDLATRIGEYKRQEDLADREQLKDLLLDVAAKIEKSRATEEDISTRKGLTAIEQQAEELTGTHPSDNVGEVPPITSVPDSDDKSAMEDLLSDVTARIKETRSTEDHKSPRNHLTVLEQQGESKPGSYISDKVGKVELIKSVPDPDTLRAKENLLLDVAARIEEIRSAEEDKPTRKSLPAVEQQCEWKTDKHTGDKAGEVHPIETVPDRDGLKAKEHLRRAEQQGTKKAQQPTNKRFGQQDRVLKSIRLPDAKSIKAEEAKDQRKKHRLPKISNEAWVTFFERAFVGTLPEDDVFNEFCQNEKFVNGEDEEMTQSVMGLAERYHDQRPPPVVLPWW